MDGLGADGLIGKLPAAAWRMSVSIKGCVSCWSGWRVPWEPSIPLACQDWANTKAAYRFFSNDRSARTQFSRAICSRHAAALPQPPVPYWCSKTRWSSPIRGSGPIRSASCTRLNSGKDKWRSQAAHGVRAADAFEPGRHAGGAALGLAAVKFWTRSKFKGLPRSRRRSIRPAFPSNRKKASAGWRTCANPPRSSAIRPDASISAIARATFTSSQLAGVLDDDDQSLRSERSASPCFDRPRNRAPRPTRAGQAGNPPCNKTLSVYLIKVARLGGYLARASDPPPGNTVMWRGLSRLADITIGATLHAQLVGN